MRAQRTKDHLSNILTHLPVADRRPGQHHRPTTQASVKPISSPRVNSEREIQGQP